MFAQVAKFTSEEILMSFCHSKGEVEENENDFDEIFAMKIFENIPSVYPALEQHWIIWLNKSHESLKMCDIAK